MKRLLKQQFGAKRSQIRREPSLTPDQPNPSTKTLKNNILEFLIEIELNLLINKSVILYDKLNLKTFSEMPVPPRLR